MDVRKLLENPRFKWERRSGASPTALSDLRGGAPPSLPVTYLRMLSICNGGRGSDPFGPGRVELWPAEDVLERNRGLALAGRLPGFLAIGQHEAGELLAFDLREPDGAPVCALRPDATRAEEVRVLSTSFSEYLQSVALYGGGA
jgi:hypothetical protein